MFTLQNPQIQMPEMSVQYCTVYSTVQCTAQCTVYRCLDVCATPQLDTVTLRPTPSDTVTIRPMSCCGLATQLQLYD